MTLVFLSVQESALRETNCKVPVFFRYCGNCGEDRKYQVGTQEERCCMDKPVAVKEDQLKNQQLSTVDMCFLDYTGEAQVSVDS
ncbi:hypothetical protein NDU88_001177 [Pleurodeles waltl]|uniref:Uncharacterized protein n=1 Tax=Pleurodeles waltl TaxID=8319 RepID=A0AAV7WHK4_PLEWA|nr:hypothetical protein NDU88_001177 [Pleurodeles waltl]